ncbi:MULTISPECIES: LCP family protein [Mesobacillus]|uniref:LCP family protein n=1 Tax=Mesobacillus TaxID=2675231 RepID=UPI001781B3A9|nr:MULTISPECIES: LCP family protein [Mesobacillus]MCM3574128.1 LCP family protein [Mesobacillus subterraneus]UYZ21625.1 LCP family protein [Mesobacillus jeotgali]
MSVDRRSLLKKRKKRRRIVSTVLFVVLFTVLTAGGYGAFLYNKAQSVIDDSYKPLDRQSDKRDKQVNPDVDNISVLFVGIDDSEARNFESASRTDALMLATLNEKDKSIKLLSIPRDSLVYIPSKGYEDKINHAYGKGGITSTIETVEELLDVPVDYYVQMNFEAFIDVVDALDGIEVEVPFELHEKDSTDRNGAVYLKPGLQTLDGEEALALARTRKLDNDIERGKRQQEILKSIMKKAASAKSITKYSDVMEAVGDNMQTDLSFSEMKALVDYATAGSSLDVETMSLQGADATIDGVYYYQLDEEALQQTMLDLKTHLMVSGQEDSHKLAEKDDEE